jgi:hypothetical protein
MKSTFTFLCLLLCLISIRVSAQTFSLTELVNLTAMDVDQFDTFVTNKGFKYLESEDKDQIKSIEYCYNQSENSKWAEKYISHNYIFFTTTDIIITYQTSKSIDYLKIKSQVKQYGFKFVKTVNENGATFLEYKRNKLKLSLISYQNETLSGKVATNYEISITRHGN